MTLDLYGVQIIRSDSPTIDAYEPLIPTLMVELAIMVDIMVIAPTQQAKIDIVLVVDFLIVLMDAVFIEHIVPPTSLH